MAMDKSTYFYIKSAFIKISNSSIKRKGCRLSFEECRAISDSHEISDAIGGYDHWKFDNDGKLITDV